MRVLAMETSGKILTVALQTPEGYRELVIDEGVRHGETLMVSVISLMEQTGCPPSDLELVACSAGPGSFTALRIGMSTAKGIVRGADCALKAVPVLPLLAAGREHWPGIVIPIMAARKGRVYAAAFQGGARVYEDADIPLKELLQKFLGNDIMVTGPDAPEAAVSPGLTLDPLYNASRGRAMIEAAVRAFQAEGSDPPDRGPAYLRLSDAEVNLKNASPETPGLSHD